MARSNKRNKLYFAMVLVLLPLIMIMEIMEVSTPALTYDRNTKLERVQFGVDKLKLKFEPSSRMELEMTIDETEMEDIIDRIQNQEGRQTKLLKVEPLLHNPNYCFTSDYHSPLDQGNTTPDHNGPKHGPFVPSRGWIPTDEKLRNSSAEKIDWIFYVHTSVGNTNKRQIIRKSWGFPRLFKRYNMRILFVVGKSDLINSQKRLEVEYSRYGDILQGDFIDTYKNITYKAVFTLRWLSTYCSHVPIVMKADDDTFINIFHIKDYLIRYSKYSQTSESEDTRDERQNEVKLLMTTPRTRETEVVSSKTIICPLYEKGIMKISRDKKTCAKWCLNRMDLPGMTTFPRYCAGLLYIFTMPLAKILYDKVATTEFLWIDDVYITGLLPQHVKNVRYVDIRAHSTLKFIVANAEYKNQSQPLIHHVVHIEQKVKFAILWNNLLSRLTADQKEELTLKPERLKLSTTLL